MQYSFWEKDQWLNHNDFVIIGSGIVGLSTALQIKQKAPSSKVLVIEKGILPEGASTKNAGFACFGSLSELIDDLDKINMGELLDLVKMRYDGLKRLRHTLGDAEIDFKPWGGYELFENPGEFHRCMDKMEQFNGLLKEITGESDTYSVADNRIGEFGFKRVSHLILNKYEGQIHTGMMMNALLRKVIASGVKVLTGIPVRELKTEPERIIIVSDNNLEINTKRAVICTNGFAKQLVPELQVEPARAQVIITEPIPGLKIKGTFHYDKGFYYFRNIGDRVLFGGGRNLDLKGENTYDFGLTNLIQSKLNQLLKDIILPDTSFVIEQKWSGIMGVGEKKSPIIRDLGNGLFCAVRMGGMGVAIGSLVGEQAADMALKA